MPTARLVVAKAILVRGATLQPGDVYAEVTFPNQAIAEHFAASLKWSAIRVELHDVVQPAAAGLPISDLVEAQGFDEALAAIGIATIGQLAAANAKALQGASGIGSANAGPLIRAAKCRIAGVAPRVARPKLAPIPDAADEGASGEHDSQESTGDGSTGETAAGTGEQQGEDNPKDSGKPKSAKKPKAGKK